MLLMLNPPCSQITSDLNGSESGGGSSSPAECILGFCRNQSASSINVKIGWQRMWRWWRPLSQFLDIQYPDCSEMGLQISLSSAAFRGCSIWYSLSKLTLVRIHSCARMHIITLPRNSNRTHFWQTSSMVRRGLTLNPNFSIAKQADFHKRLVLIPPIRRTQFTLVMTLMCFEDVGQMRLWRQEKLPLSLGSSTTTDGDFGIDDIKSGNRSIGEWDRVSFAFPFTPLDLSTLPLDLGPQDSVMNWDVQFSSKARCTTKLGYVNLCLVCYHPSMRGI